MNGTIESVEELLAHAYALEMEAVSVYEEIADSMEVHNNLEVAELLRRLADNNRKHADQMKTMAAGKDLPHIAPWEFKWPAGRGPEAAAMEDTHYLMTPYHALRIAHRAEMRAHDFYFSIEKTGADPNVRDLAARFADEEAGHVVLLEDMMKKYPKPEAGWDFDPDLPNMPE